MIKDQVSAKESVGVGTDLSLSEKSNHKTIWTIDRHDEEVFERKVKALKIRRGELLILANYHFARGDRESWFKYASEAEKIKKEAQAYGYNQSNIENNLLLNEGIDEIWSLVSGAGGTAYNNANARLGVGDSSAAAAPTQTDLQASANKLYKGMSPGFPTFSPQKITFESVFNATEANFSWNEFSLDNGGASLKNLNRKVQGTTPKVNPLVWTLTLNITLS